MNNLIALILISLCCTIIYAAPVPHTHGGREHSHPLPKEGIKHRHGGGAIGLAVPGGDVASAPSIKSGPIRYSETAVIPIPSENRTYYFEINKNLLSFSFSLPGMWQRTNQTGLLTSTDRKKQAGVSLGPGTDVKGYQGKDLLARAVSATVIFNEKRHGKPADSSKVVPFKSNYSGSIKWIGRWNFTRGGKRYIAEVIRYFVEVKPDWVAVITASHLTNGHDMALQIIKSISVTDNPDVYRQRVRELKKKK